MEHGKGRGNKWSCATVTVDLTKIIRNGLPHKLAFQNKKTPYRIIYSGKFHTKNAKPFTRIISAMCVLIAVHNRDPMSNVHKRGWRPCWCQGLLLVWLKTCQKSQIKQAKRANCHNPVSRVVNFAVFSDSQSKSRRCLVAVAWVGFPIRSRCTCDDE